MKAAVSGNGKRAKSLTCAVITRFGQGLNDEGCQACIRMISNSYPEYAADKEILLLSGPELNNLENMTELIQKNQDMFLVLSADTGLRLLPSGPEHLKDYIPVFEEAVRERTFVKTWDLLDAFIKAMAGINEI